MQLIITKEGTDILVSIEVPNDADAELLIQMIQAEIGVPIQEQRLEFEGTAVRAGPLASQGIVDGSSIVVKQVQSAQQSSSNSGQTHLSPASVQLVDPASVAPEHLLDLIRQNPTMLMQYKRLDSELGTCLEQNDPAKLRVFIMKRAMSRHKIVYEAKMEEMALATADPMDPEVQAKIAEKVSHVFTIQGCSLKH